MFFVQTLGPALTPAGGAALFDHVQSKLRGKKSVSAAELHAAVSEFLLTRANTTSPEAAIQFLKKIGRVTQDGAAYKLQA